jgi:hypothetical protein
MENQVPQSIAPQLIYGASISRVTVVIFLSEEFDADHQKQRTLLGSEL